MTLKIIMQNCFEEEKETTWNDIKVVSESDLLTTAINS